MIPQDTNLSKAVIFREATLRRHNEMEHEDKSDDSADDEGDADDDYNDEIDDGDDEYKPTAIEVKAEVAEDREEAEEMPPLTAEEMAEIDTAEVSEEIPVMVVRRAEVVDKGDAKDSEGKLP